MSQLRKQLKELLPGLREEAKQLRDRDARKRLEDLQFIAFSERSLSHACGWRGVSEDYFRKWARKLLNLKSLMALLSGSRKPKESPRELALATQTKVVSLRKARPYLGAERIKSVLNMRVSVSAIYNVLKRKNLISPVRQKRLTKRHLKRYRRTFPGYLQMDFKYVPYLILGKQYYQLSCVDHHSSWRLIRIYPHKDLAAVMDFLKLLYQNCPFGISEIQTDNDASFTDKYTGGDGGQPTGLHSMDTWCVECGIRHKLIPIGEKEINGKVENTHKQDDREFYSQSTALTYESLCQAALVHEYQWNTERRTKALQWKTVEETLLAATVTAIAWLGYQAERRTALTQPKKPKHFSLVNRYIKWAEEDAKKWGKYAILYPPMSQIFSEV